MLSHGSAAKHWPLRQINCQTTTTKPLALNSLSFGEGRGEVKRNRLLSYLEVQGLGQAPIAHSLLPKPMPPKCLRRNDAAHSPLARTENWAAHHSRFTTHPLKSLITIAFSPRLGTEFAHGC